MNIKKIGIIFSSFLLLINFLSAQIMDGCDLPDSETTGYFHLRDDGSVLYKTPDAMGGFQFTIDGATVSGASGGDASVFIVNTSGSTVLAFSLSGATIPVGCGILTNLTLSEEAMGFSNIVVSDAFASAIPFEYFEGGSDDENITDGCDLPDSGTTGYLHLTDEGQVLYKSPWDLGGWQFTVDGALVVDAFGGVTGENGFIISAAGSNALAFSLSGSVIPAGCGLLVELELDGDASGLSGLVVSDPNAQSLYFEYFEGGSSEIEGCMDVLACNYNSDATVDDGSCEEFDECGECGGSGAELGYDCTGTPIEFQFNASMQQAYYFFTSVTLDGIQIDNNDWVGAFNDGICVGSLQWDTSQCGSGICSVPVMGDDGWEFSEGYMLLGDIPMFQIFDASDGIAS